MAADDYRAHLIAVELVTAKTMALLARIERDQMVTDVRIQMALEAVEESRRLLSALDASKQRALHAPKQEELPRDELVGPSRPATAND